MDVFEAVDSRIACRQFFDKPVDPASLSPEHLEEVETFLAAIDANDDVQNVYVGLAG